MVSVGQLYMVADLYGYAGGVGLQEPVHQRRRRDFRRRSPATGGHQLFRRRHYRAAKYSQHIFSRSLTISLTISIYRTENYYYLYAFFSL